MRAADLDLAVAERAAYLPDADALVIADLHLGRAATSRVDLPLPEREAILDRLGGLLDRFEPAEAVVAGDVLDAFDRVPDGIEGTLSALRDAVEGAGADLVLVAGNHDAMLSSVADAVPVHRLADGTVVHHGHEPPDVEASRYVVGHDHPAIEIEGRRRPCLLVGERTYRGADVVCLPAFNGLCAGTPVNGLGPGDAHSPLLSDPGPFRPVVRDPDAGETFLFPPLAELGGFL